MSNHASLVYWLVIERRGNKNKTFTIIQNRRRLLSLNISDTKSSTLPRSTEGSSVPTFSFRKDYKKFTFFRVVRFISK